MNLFDLPQGSTEDESVLRIPAAAGLSQIWCKKDRPSEWHRLRGPACIFVNGAEVWWRDDRLYAPTAHELMLWHIRKANINCQTFPKEQ